MTGLPLTSSSHLLPLEKLSPEDFERLCYWLVQREGYTNVEHVGVSGNDQGRDLVAWRQGRRVIFQCKRVREFRPQDIILELTKLQAVSTRPDELVFIVTCAVSARSREVARELWGDEETCQFWASTELDERVKRYPEILREFFHLPLGESQTSTPDIAESQALELYLSALAEYCGQPSYISLSTMSLPSLSSVYVTQQVEDPVNRETFSAEDVFTKGNVILQGVPGIGKSSLLYQGSLRLINSILGDNSLSESSLIPVLVAARNLTEPPDSFANAIQSAVARELGYLLPRPLPINFFARPPLPNARWLVLVDGLDEVVAPHDRKRLMTSLAVQSRQSAPLYKFVLTARPFADAHTFSDEFKAFNLLPLVQNSTDQFAQRWFTGRSENPEEDIRTFLARVRQSRILDLSRVPLLLTMSAIVYERDRKSAFPTRRAGLYSRFVTILLEDEESLRNTREKFRAEWARRLGQEGLYEADRLFSDRWPMVQALALAQQTKPDSDLLEEGIRYSRERLAFPLMSLNQEWLEQQVAILMLRTGLIIRRAGREDFSHSTLREFAAASALAVRLTPLDEGIWHEIETLGGVHEAREVILFMLSLWSNQGANVSTLLGALARESLEGLQVAGAALADDVEIDSATKATVIEGLLAEVQGLKNNFVSVLAPYSPLRLLGNIRNGNGISQRLERLAQGSEVGNLVLLGIGLALESQGSKDSAVNIFSRLAQKDDDAGVFSLHQLKDLSRAPELIDILRDSSAVSVMRMLAANMAIDIKYSKDVIAAARDRSLDDDGRKAAMSALGIAGKVGELLLIARDRSLSQDLCMALCEVLEKGAHLDAIRTLIYDQKAKLEARKAAGIALFRLGRSVELKAIAHDPRIDSDVARFIAVMAGERDRSVIQSLGRPIRPDLGHRPDGKDPEKRKAKRRMEKKSRKNNRRKR